MIESDKSRMLRLNSVTSCLLQLTTIICGFIVPRLILGAYGSETYGLVNSITQFLQIITFMEMGVGAVVQSSLYKPLADHDKVKVSAIFRSTERFFRTIAAILVGYVLFLLLFYPVFISKFDSIFTVILILALGANSFFQYFVGMPERLLLLADQKGYVQYCSQIILLIINTALCAFLINRGTQVYTVKFVSALVFLVGPIFLREYVRKNYSIDRKIVYSEEPIKQKWNGIAQHIAAVILDQTDVVILTVFSTLSNVSIYSVYHLVVFGMKKLFLSLMGGVQPLMGEYIAKEEKDKLRSLFDWTEWIIHTGTTMLFVCAGVLIVPFVKVYTKGVNDADYVVPVFAALITIANAGHCLRLPYNIMILAAGHYKETQHNYIIAAAMNVLISVLAVHKWGLVGVAVGTVVAMVYQTIWMAYYDSKNILDYKISGFWKHCLVDVVVAGLTVASTMPFSLRNVDYLSWALLAVEKGLVCVAIAVVVNMVFYRRMMVEIKDKVARRIVGE